LVGKRRQLAHQISSQAQKLKREENLKHKQARKEVNRRRGRAGQCYTRSQKNLVRVSVGWKTANRMRKDRGSDQSMTQKVPIACEVIRKRGQKRGQVQKDPSADHKHTEKEDDRTKGEEA